MPVLVEGPIDALAVTLASDGRYVGVAPLGTALTDEQARQLATLSTHPTIATDADVPGRVAAERAFWLLTQHGTDPLAIDLRLSPARPRPGGTPRTPRQLPLSWARS